MKSEITITFFLTVSSLVGFAQQIKGLHSQESMTSERSSLKDSKNSYNHLFQYGIASAFIGGVYQGSLPVKEIKAMGDFGLGAPDLLDGELTILNGIVYQTRANGETTTPKEDFTTSFAFTTFFKADTVFYLSTSSDKAAVSEKISRFLQHKNSVYALKITGEFKDMKTRAFPAVDAVTSAPLITFMDKQRIFNYKNCSGFLVGYYFPEYLNGLNIAGYHFHYLSQDKTKGGHVLDFLSSSLKIEIAEIKAVAIKIPSDNSFQNFDFPKNKNESLEKVETGKQ
ncbi:acetolactate decarboxylase [Mucilaginibacter sp. HD30]